MIVSKGLVRRLDISNDPIEIPSIFGYRDFYTNGKPEIRIYLSDQSELKFFIKKIQQRELRKLIKKLAGGSEMVVEIKISEGTA